jgi:4-hydroxy-tetrahydrodipicolinate reductase
MTINLAIAGAAGRMGRALIQAATNSDDRLAIVGGTEHPQSPHLGLDIGLLDGKLSTGHVVCDTVQQACADAHVWIDFTTPQASIAALEALSTTKVKAAIIGTTGFDDAQQDQIKAASQHLAIVQSGNFSLGVNLVAALVRQAAARLGPDWDIEVLESHHRDKIDAPSGTAFMFGRAAADGRGVDHDTHAVFARDGKTGARKSGDIGYASLRAGGIIGDHEIMFAARDEIVTLGHKAGSRTIFAKGALKAALWASTQSAGLYTMADVLGL